MGAVHEDERVHDKVRDRPAPASAEGKDTPDGAEVAVRPVAIAGLAVPRKDSVESADKGEKKDAAKPGVKDGAKDGEGKGGGEEGVTGIDPDGRGAPPAGSSGTGGSGSAGAADDGAEQPDGTGYFQADEQEASAQSHDPDLMRAALTHDPSDIKLVETANFAKVSEKLRITLLAALLHQGWVGPRDEAAAERIWDSFGAELPGVVSRHAVLWKDGIEKGVDPSNIPAADKVRRAFELDVKQVADDHMQANWRFAAKEQAELALPPSAAGPDGATRAKRSEQIQQAASQSKRLLALQERLKSITVGYKPMPAGEMGVTYVPAGFDPDDPGQATMLLDSDPGAPVDTKVKLTWKDVKPHWDAVTAALSVISSKDPAVYAAVTSDHDALDTMSKSPEKAREEAGRLLATLQQNITETIAKLTDGSLNWMDLTPIHEQLFSGQVRTKSGVDWTSAFAQGVAKDVIGDHKTEEFWKQLGLGTLTAALFIVAEFATAGWATAALMAGGVTMSAGQAASAWSDYGDLRTSAASATSAGTQVVSKEQVDEARLNAIISTVGAVVDVVAPVKALKAGAEVMQLENALATRSAAAVLEQAFKGGGAVVGEQGSRLVERGIAELGVQETLVRTGKSAEELLNLVPEKSRAAERLREAIQAGLADGAKPAAVGGAQGGAKGGAKAAARAAAAGTEAEQALLQGKSLPEALAGLMDSVKSQAVSRELGEKIVQEAIDKLGPAETVKACGGWKAMSEALGKESTAGRRLMDWRDAVYEDLEKYVREEAGGSVQRTGTQENFSNDIDISFTGKDAGATLQKGKLYLAKRLGIDPSDSKAIEDLLMAGLFTDPRRMHLYDQLPEALRTQLAKEQANKEQGLIWNRRLWEASEHEKEMPGLTEKIRKQMQDLKIEQFTYKPLAESDRLRLGADLDKLHARLDKAVAAEDLAAQRELVTQIADTQAVINASEGGGYFSAGGVRRYVSERAAFEKGEAPEFPRLGNADAPRPDPEKLTTLVDQLSKLDHGVLNTVSSDPSKVVDGIRSVGKYGGRLQAALREAGFAVDAGDWVELEKLCKQLKEVAEKGTTEAMDLKAGKDEVITKAKDAFSKLVTASETALQHAQGASDLPNAGRAAAAVQQAVEGRGQLLMARDQILTALQRMLPGVQASGPVISSALSSDGSVATSGRGTSGNAAARAVDTLEKDVDALTK